MKTGIPSSSSLVSNTVELHYSESSKISGEKARWELQKDAVHYFDERLKATPPKTIERPLTSHLTNCGRRAKHS